MNSLPRSISRLSNLISTALLFVAPAAFLLTGGRLLQAATIEVTLQMTATSHFSPKTLTIHPGDTVKWVWGNDGLSHSVVSGDGNTGTPNGIFNSGIHSYPYTYSFTFPNIGYFPYYCGVHYPLNHGGPWPTITVVAPTTRLSNISTRAVVQIDNKVLIGGFVVDGTGAKQLLLRVLGPTLSQFGINGALLNPTLELHNSSGGVVAFNDNWATAANAQSIPVNLRPPNSVEPAILASLNPGSYTAIVHGINNTTGIGLVEAYDLDTSSTSRFTNISTRGFVGTSSNVMIAGIIVQGSSQNAIVRALGPTLASLGVSDSLADPTLELFDANGSLLASNDNWKSTQEAAITFSGYAPPNDLESAIFRTLGAGNYTAIVRGVNNTTGVALAEVYSLN